MNCDHKKLFVIEQIKSTANQFINVKEFDSIKEEMVKNITPMNFSQIYDVGDKFIVESNIVDDTHPHNSSSYILQLNKQILPNFYIDTKLRSV